MQVGMSLAEVTLQEVSHNLPELAQKEWTLREILKEKSFEISVRVPQLSEDEVEGNERYARVVFSASEKGVRITIYHGALDQAYSLTHNAQFCEQIIESLKQHGAVQVLELAVQLYELLYHPLQRLIAAEVERKTLSLKTEIDTLKVKLSGD